MKFGFIKVAASTPKVRVADCKFNCENIINDINLAYEKKAGIIVFPELSITGYTCGDLFLQKRLIDSSYDCIEQIRDFSKGKEILVVVGAPFDYLGKLYNCGFIIYNGKILAIIPKTFLPNYNEFYEMRWFNEALTENKKIEFLGDNVVFGTKVLVQSKEIKELRVGFEICEDLWSVMPPSLSHSLAGATIIANLSAGNEITGKSIYRKELVKSQSARIIGGYIYACQGDGESTTDVVFSGHNLICENGNVLNESKLFENGIIYSDIDVSRLYNERCKNTSFRANDDGYEVIEIEFKGFDYKIDRFIDPHPFVPKNQRKRDERCNEIINIQAHGLKKRIEHIGNKNVIIGISGGLDSTQALIVADRAYELLGLDKKGIIAVTMPSFGTTDRTYNNAINLVKRIGATLIEVDIKKAVLQHFEDIGHSSEKHDLTYENSQARQRTMVLMNLASKYNGFVIGTGDLSELALGWATYNGDHMSMYGVNCSVPKTLIKYLIEYYAETTKDEVLRDILMDILDTPVSPELLPPDEKGEIAQITEDVVGPYELHDFFLYNMMRLSFEPDKIFYLAKIAFENKYDEKVIYKWLRTFYWRFFSQQFKRNCIPDGPKVGSVSLSPRGDWRMPSDASSREWLVVLDEIGMELELKYGALEK